MSQARHRAARGHRPKVLAISSGGGHWVQLCRVAEAFEGADVVFATVKPEYREDRPGDRVYVVSDATRWDRLRLVLCALQIVRILWIERPSVVVTTGAAPGGLAIVLARLVRARTLWLDSIANVEELSMTGRRASRLATVCLTQWSHLAEPDGPEYAGAVF